MYMYTIHNTLCFFIFVPLSLSAPKAFNASAALTISKMMDTWTKQMGYPVVHITISSDGNTLSYKQQRFLQNPLPSGGEVAPSPYKLV